MKPQKKREQGPKDGPKRDTKGRLLPGHTANPGGRPKIVKDFRKRCQEFMEREGWKHLQRLARAGRFRAEALKLLSAYAYGRPSERIEVDQDRPFRIEVEYLNDWRGEKRSPTR